MAVNNNPIHIRYRTAFSSVSRKNIPHYNYIQLICFGYLFFIDFLLNPLDVISVIMEHFRDFPFVSTFSIGVVSTQSIVPVFLPKLSFVNLKSVCVIIKKINRTVRRTPRATFEHNFALARTHPN